MINREQTPLVCLLVDTAGQEVAIRSTLIAGEALELILKEGIDKQGVFAYLTLWTLVYAVSGAVAMNLDDLPPSQLGDVNKLLPELMKEATLAAIRDVDTSGVGLGAASTASLESLLRGTGIGPPQEPFNKPKRRWWNIW